MRLAAASLLLAGCVAAPDYGWWYRSADALAKATPTMTWHLASQRGMSPEYISLRETQLRPILADRCAEPLFEEFNRAADRAANEAEHGDPIGAFNRLMPAAWRADGAIRSCFRREGADGSVFMIVAGTEFTIPDYVDALLRLAMTSPATHAAAVSAAMSGFGGGCGSRGGPGWRKGDGRCASWRD